MSLITLGVLGVSQKLLQSEIINNDVRIYHYGAGRIKNFLMILGYNFLNFSFDKNLASATLLTFNIFLSTTVSIINCINFVWLQIFKKIATT